MLREATRLEIERALSSNTEREQPVDEKTAFGQLSGADETGAKTSTLEHGADVYTRRYNKRSATMVIADNIANYNIYGIGEGDVVIFNPGSDGKLLTLATPTKPTITRYERLGALFCV